MLRRAGHPAPPGLLFLGAHQESVPRQLLMDRDLSPRDKFTWQLLLNAAESLNHIDQWGLNDNGIMHWLAQMDRKIQASPTAASVYAQFAPYLQSSLYAVLTLLLRLMLLVIALPLYALAVIVGLVGGLARRDIRRFSSGYESGFVHHHARRSTGSLCILSWLLYLSSPIAVRPDVMLAPPPRFWASLWR